MMVHQRATPHTRQKKEKKKNVISLSSYMSSYVIIHVISQFFGGRGPKLSKEIFLLFKDPPAQWYHTKLKLYYFFNGYHRDHHIYNGIASRVVTMGYHREFSYAQSVKLNNVMQFHYIYIIYIYKLLMIM